LCAVVGYEKLGNRGKVGQLYGHRAFFALGC
jgi:hypothetical protein